MLLPTAFVVVELFTSQGCSSCPPADEVLSELRRDAHVIALAWHVDYWDRLGWKDPYSSPRATARQRWYGNGLSTPQAVVNGHDAVLGSDRAELRRLVAEAKSPAVNVTVEAKLDHGAVRVHATADKEGPLLIVLYEDDLITHVGRGENEGRTLRNDGVVRTVAEGPDAVFFLADDWKGDHLHVAAIAQDPRSKLILGAARWDVPGPTPTR